MNNVAIIDCSILDGRARDFWKCLEGTPLTWNDIKIFVYPALGGLAIKAKANFDDRQFSHVQHLTFHILKALPMSYNYTLEFTIRKLGEFVREHCTG